MPSYFRHAHRSNTGDRQVWSIPSAMDEATYAADAALHDAFQAELFNWLSGKADGREDVIERSAPVGGASNHADANKALQLKVEFLDAVTGQSYVERIPFPLTSKAADGGANPAWTTVNGLRTMNPLHADYAAFVSAIEAFYITPNGNNGVFSRGWIEE